MSPAVNNDGLVSSLLLHTQDLVNQVNHPCPRFRSTVLRPGHKLEVVDHPRGRGALYRRGELRGGEGEEVGREYGRLLSYFLAT